MIGELSADDIEQIFRSQFVARVGCHSAGITYVVPITYVYDGKSLIGHSPVGMKIRMMRENPFVCVEVDQITGPTDWRSVIAWGRYEELFGQEAEAGMEQLVQRLRPMFTKEPGRLLHGLRAAPAGAASQPVAVVYAIRLREMTGRFESPGRGAKA